MKNIGVAIVLAAAFGISGLAAAQTGHNLMVANAHCSEGLFAEHNQGYVSFVAGAGGVQATVSTTQAANAYSFKTFQITGGAAGAQHVVGGLPEMGFKALHGYSNLSAAISYYWDTFTGMGYSATLASLGTDTSTYTFENGVSSYEAVFTMEEDDISVTFTPVPTLYAGR